MLSVFFRAGKIAGITAAVLLVLEILVMLSGGGLVPCRLNPMGTSRKCRKFYLRGILSKLQSVQLIICSFPYATGAERLSNRAHLLS